MIWRVSRNFKFYEQEVNIERNGGWKNLIWILSIELFELFMHKFSHSTSDSLILNSPDSQSEMEMKILQIYILFKKKNLPLL